SALCGIAVAALAVPCVAQRGQPQPTAPSSPSSSGPVLGPSPTLNPDVPDGFSPWNTTIPGVIMVPADAARMVDSEGCNTWTESGVHTPTVSVTRLKVPDKAIGEFQKACSSYKDKNLSKAEEHARKAIGIYADYAASWVLLGQVLDAQHNRTEADKACSQAATIDPQYIASYLCLADFAARDENWDQLSKLSDEALAIDPVGNAYALYYSADADFHTKKLADAETSARAAVRLDPWHKMPQLHLLLAHIYRAKGDPHSEIAELRDYLKQASNAPDALAVRATLKQLESPSQNQPSSAVQ
ncbi:MAG TPA: hypothetical protein VLW83_17295, partial [Candidatus Acidoferrales bacterium]|nr:hypothetical protein [Candidatus Acidoferrales bacterium]